MVLAIEQLESKVLNKLNSEKRATLQTWLLKEMSTSDLTSSVSQGYMGVILILGWLPWSGTNLSTPRTLGASL